MKAIDASYYFLKVMEKKNCMCCIYKFGDEIK